MDITYLSAKYEASANPGTISGGIGDLGGASYGAFQFNSRDDIVTEFLVWVQNNIEEPLRNYATVLLELGVYSDEFDEKWREIAEIDPQGFLSLQSAYAKTMYFDPAVNRMINKTGVDITKRTQTLQAVLMSRAIQYSSYWMPELFEHGVRFAKENYNGLEAVTGIDDCPDYYLISGIYDYLHADACNAYRLSSGLYHSPDDWSNGSYDVIGGLKNRFISEKLDAFAMLEEERKGAE